MGRRTVNASDVEAWRYAFHARVALRDGQDLADLALDQLDEEIALAGHEPDTRPLAETLAECRAHNIARQTHRGHA